MVIQKILLVSGLVLSFVGFAGCSTMSDRNYMDNSSSGDEYVYILDYERIAKIEAAARTSHSNVETYWINPPVKRITRDELKNLQEKQ